MEHKGYEYEVVVIGGGIIGAFTFNNLVLSGVKAVLVEAGEDVSVGATKANSAIIHAGYDCKSGTNKAKFNVRGNQMYEQIAKRLGEKIKKTGSLVVSGKDGLSELERLYNQGIQNGVVGLKILEREELLKLEPNLSKNVSYGLYAPSAMIVSPYNFAISLCEEAMINGGKLLLNFEVDKIVNKGDFFEVYSKEKMVTGRFVINCAGAGCAKINSLVGAEKLDIHLTKGEYLILDKSEKGLVNRPIFPLPTKAGKGILVLPTVSNNILCGPTARDISEFDTSVTPEGIAEIKQKTGIMVDNLNFKKVIKLYAGVRVKCGDDFIVGFSKIVPNFYITAGIASPGLASAPAIAEKIMQDLTLMGVRTKKFTPKRRTPYTDTRALTKTELNNLIKKNSKYGRLVCRCEGITEGEIEEVLKGPISPLTIEGIKRRLRPTMGRCQGSFCLPSLIEILSKAYKTAPENIVVANKTPLILNSIKEGGIYENWCCNNWWRFCWNECCS